MSQAQNRSDTTQSRRNFYNLEQINAIPILDVCSHFGIRVKYKGRDPWCSIRSEDRTPSTILHVDPRGRFKVNTYCDFGAGNETGNNVDLACHMLNLNRDSKTDRYTAIEHLAQTFRIPPSKGNNFNPGDLSDHEWALLGIYGDRATKNFRFDSEHMSLERITAISQKYNMTMNDLKKAHPHTFERLIKARAIPHLQEARNNYYMQLWMSRNNLRYVFGQDATLSDHKDFSDNANELRSMEKALNRAIMGTELIPVSTQDYTPATILERIDNGQLKPNFGSKTYSQMARLAEANQTVVKYRTLDVSRVYYEGSDLFGDIPFSAFLKDGNAVVGYLEKDAQRLSPIFQRLSATKPPLSAKLQDAKARQTQSSANSSPKKKTQMR